MYILRGKRRNELRWLLGMGLLAVVFVVLLAHFHAILARDAFILLDIFFVFSLLLLSYFLRNSDEKSLLASPGFLSNSPTQFTFFFYLGYGSIVLYPLVEKRFRPEFIGYFGFVVIFLAMVFPDALLFLRTKLDSGKAIYQKANRIGFWILLLFVIVSVGAGILAGR